MNTSFYVDNLPKSYFSVAVMNCEIKQLYNLHNTLLDVVSFKKKEIDLMNNIEDVQETLVLLIFEKRSRQVTAFHLLLSVVVLPLYLTGFVFQGYEGKLQTVILGKFAKDFKKRSNYV